MEKEIDTNGLIPNIQRPNVIFFRKWYFEGVSVKNNTLELFLNQLCKRYDIYTIWISTEGFAVLVFSIMIKAKRVYAFNAQLTLNIIIKDSSPFVDPI